jgi:malonate transporter MadL subunit
MIIYGVAILSACLLVGVFVGDLLGTLIGVQANVGGVGFAMLLLIFITDYLRRRGTFCEVSQMGIGFWSAMYIPIVVAMAAQQNVVAALSGGAGRTARRSARGRRLRRPRSGDLPHRRPLRSASAPRLRKGLMS